MLASTMSCALHRDSLPALSRPDAWLHEAARASVEAAGRSAANNQLDEHRADDGDVGDGEQQQDADLVNASRVVAAALELKRAVAASGVGGAGPASLLVD